MTYDVVTIGTATRDVYVRGPMFRIIRDRRSATGQSLCLDFGAKYDLPHLLFETGGGATNTAVTFAQFGFRTALLGAIGKDVRGQAVKELMRQKRVSTALVSVDPHRPTAYSIILSAPSGERTILSFRGASVHGDLLIRALRKAWTAHWLFLTSLGGNLHVTREIFQKAHRAKSSVAWNPGERELKKGKRALLPFLRQTSVLFLNFQEAQLLTRAKKDPPSTLAKQLRALTDATIVLTDGKSGSWALAGSTLYHAGIHDIPVVDTTGAGDAFGSGFLTGLMRKPGNVAFALQLGTANAEGTIGSVGAKTGLLRSTPRARSLVRVQKVH